MAKKREFEIAFVGLKPGIHEFTYDIDDKFFAGLETREFSNCHAKVKLSLDKKSSFMMLKFEVGGKADVICDRCSNTITIDLWDEFNMLVKMVENPDQMNEQEDDPDVFYISKTESHLYLNNWLFEFVSLSVPAQKTCSPEEFGGPGCNKEVLDVLKKMGSKDIKTGSNDVWKGLEKFKDGKKDLSKEN
ncbi:MAG: YceD family protein [Ferruginibacter sp.]